MTSFCKAEGCEGWSYQPEDRYCVYCGGALANLELELFEQVGPDWRVTRVFGNRPCRLTLKAGHRGFDLSLQDWPSWWPSELLPSVLEPAQQVTIEVPPLSGTLSDTAQVAGQTLCRSGEGAQAALTLDLLQGRGCYRLELRQGAAWLDRCPHGVIPVDPLPQLLHARENPGWSFRLPTGQVPDSVDLGPLGVLALPHFQPTQIEWNLSQRPILEIPTPSRPLDIRCPAPLEFSWSEADKSLQLRPIGVSEGDIPLEVHLQQGVDQHYLLQLHSSPRREFAGWLVLDLGTGCSAAATLALDGQVQLLELGQSSPFWPSGVRYSATGAWQACQERGPDVAHGAKRLLGTLTEAFALTSQGQILRVDPAQVVQDSLRLLLERVEELHFAEFGRICLTYPAAYSPRQQAALESAFRGAWTSRGYQVPLQLVLMAEPLASSYHYLTHPAPNGGASCPPQIKELLCVDIGAGTTDCAWLRVDSQDRGRVRVQLVNVGGNRWFGGDDITRWIADSLNYSWNEAEQHKRSSISDHSHAWDTELAAALERALGCRRNPDQIVLSGQGSLYPGVRRWFEKRFPQAQLVLHPQPKAGVVLGAIHHPEITRTQGPRQLSAEQIYLDLSAPAPVPVATTRLGIRLVGPDGPEFRCLTELGQEFGESVLQPVAFQAGSNPIEILENLGEDNQIVGPNGQRNPLIVPLTRIDLQLAHTAHPHHTRMLWNLDCNYRLTVTVCSDESELARVGPLELMEKIH